MERESKYRDQDSIIIDERHKKLKDIYDIKVDQVFDDFTDSNENLHLTDLKQIT